MMNTLYAYRIRFRFVMSLLIVLPSLWSNTYAQDSTAIIEEAKVKTHSPKLATTLSAVIPGLGQVYNKKYWKVPVIYAGIGALYYAISFNSERYDIYKSAYSFRIDGDSSTIDIYDVQLDNGEPKYTDESLLKLKDFYRRNRDVSYIFMGVLYMLNIVDAAVDAHFFDYKITDDLSLEVHPAIMFGTGRIPTTGIGLTLRL